MVSSFKYSKTFTALLTLNYPRMNQLEKNYLCLCATVRLQRYPIDWPEAKKKKERFKRKREIFQWLGLLAISHEKGWSGSATLLGECCY